MNPNPPWQVKASAWPWRWACIGYGLGACCGLKRGKYLMKALFGVPGVGVREQPNKDGSRQRVHQVAGEAEPVAPSVCLPKPRLMLAQRGKYSSCLSLPALQMCWTLLHTPALPGKRRDGGDVPKMLIPPSLQPLEINKALWTALREPLTGHLHLVWLQASGGTRMIALVF